MYFLMFFWYLFVPCGKFGSSYLGKATAAARTALPISYQCVQYFPVSKQWRDCQCLGVLTCAQMLMHAIAHEGCTDTVRESALEVDSGRKIPLPNLGLEPTSVLRLEFRRTLYPLSYQRSAPGPSPYTHTLLVAVT